MSTAAISNTNTNLYQRDINRLVAKSYTYLLNNFAKFSTDNKIKVALKIVDKHMDVELARLLKEKAEGELLDTEIEFVGMPTNGEGRALFSRFYN